VYAPEIEIHLLQCATIPFENMGDSFCQIWDSESTPESYDSFHLEQKNRSRRNSKFRDKCQHKSSFGRFQRCLEEIFVLKIQSGGCVLEERVNHGIALSSGKSRG
jgi:hypothetical protein